MDIDNRRLFYAIVQSFASHVSGMLKRSMIYTSIISREVLMVSGKRHATMQRAIQNLLQLTLALGLC